MKKIVAMTVYDRQPDVLRSVIHSLSFPGNMPDALVVCYDRASDEARTAVRESCRSIGLDLRESSLDDSADGFRCPSLAWNTVFSRIPESHALCISSDCVLAPHSVHKAFHMALYFDDWMIVGRADHCGPSYSSSITIRTRSRNEPMSFLSRTMTSSHYFKAIGFAWVLPMTRVRRIGGYDLEFMGGFCFEDDDFTIRMWDTGMNIMFLDDLHALHIEHQRPHVLDEEKIQRNKALFENRHGPAECEERSKGLPKQGFNPHIWVNEDSGPGLSVWCHEYDPMIPPRAIGAEIIYGNDEPWRAIKTTVIYAENTE